MTAEGKPIEIRVTIHIEDALRKCRERAAKAKAAKAA